MKLVTISLALYLSVVLAQNRVERAHLKNLGIARKVSLPTLGFSSGFSPSTNENMAIRTSSAPIAFRFSSTAGENVGFTSPGFGFSSDSSSTGSSGNRAGYDYSSQDSSSSTYSFSSQGSNGITSDIPVNLLDKQLHESDIPDSPFPIIPVNSSFSIQTEKGSSDNDIKKATPPQYVDYSSEFPVQPVLDRFDGTSDPTYNTFNPPDVNQSAERLQPQVPILSSQSLEQVIEEEWNDFKIRFNKVYKSEEETRYRREIFIENRAKIIRFNTEYAEGKRNYVHKINEFADLLLHEFSNNLNGYNRSTRAPSVPIKPASSFIPSANVVFPDSVDWRMVGAVGPVKSQGKCAGCWAFAAAGAIEGHQFRKTGELVEVSVQNLIDCTERYGNNGCSGGLMDPAFEYVRDNNGVDSEQSYPFEERDATCRFKRENVVATCTGFVDIKENDEKQLEIAVATLGPVTAAIDAGQESFQFYSGEIYDDPKCGNQPEQLNHAVLIVGYGQEADGRKYWLVKNSYGQNWGIGGYIKIAKDNNNQCGIAVQASYPLV